MKKNTLMKMKFIQMNNFEFNCSYVFSVLD